MNDPISINTAEPTLEQLAALRKAAGDEHASIHFERITGGTRVALRTSEQPPREWSTVIGTDANEAQRNGVYDELAARIAKLSRPDNAEADRAEHEEPRPSPPRPSAPRTSTTSTPPPAPGGAHPPTSTPGGSSTPRGREPSNR